MNKKIIIPLSIVIGIVAIALIMHALKKEEPAIKADNTPYFTPKPDNSASAILKGYSITKAYDICEKIAFKTTQDVMHNGDSLIEYGSSSVGHDGKLQGYRMKIKIKKTEDGAEVKCSNDWSDGYASQINEMTIASIKRESK